MKLGFFLVVFVVLVNGEAGETGQLKELTDLKGLKGLTDLKVLNDLNEPMDLKKSKVLNEPKYLKGLKEPKHLKGLNEPKDLNGPKQRVKEDHGEQREQLHSETSHSMECEIPLTNESDLIDSKEENPNQEPIDSCLILVQKEKEQSQPFNETEKLSHKKEHRQNLDSTLPEENPPEVQLSSEEINQQSPRQKQNISTISRFEQAKYLLKSCSWIIFLVFIVFRVFDCSTLYYFTLGINGIIENIPAKAIWTSFGKLIQLSLQQ